MEIKRKIYGKFLTWKNEVQGKKASNPVGFRAFFNAEIRKKDV